MSDKKATKAVRKKQARLQQVGWYCAEHFCVARSTLQDRSPHIPVSVKRLDEMHCEHAVPVYVLVKVPPKMRTELPTPSVHQPAWAKAANPSWRGRHLVVGLSDGREMTGKNVGLVLDGPILRLHLEVVDRTGVRVKQIDADAITSLELLSKPRDSSVDWDYVANLVGAMVTVSKTNGDEVSGKFMVMDDARLLLRLRGGAQELVMREHVRAVEEER